MNVLWFLLPWVLIGIGVLYVGFSGGPGRAREAYLTRAGRGFKLTILIVYLGIGVTVPAIILASRGNAQGATSKLETVRSKGDIQRGKTLFRATCASCHTLAAVNARGVTGPDLDRIGAVTKARVLSAIKVGGTGQGRMPAGLLQGSNAQAVAAFVSTVAGK